MFFSAIFVIFLHFLREAKIENNPIKTVRISELNPYGFIRYLFDMLLFFVAKEKKQKESTAKYFALVSQQCLVKLPLPKVKEKG